MNLPHSCSTHTHAGSCTYIQLTRPKIFSEWQDRIEIVCGFTTGAVFNMNKSWIHRPVKFHYTCCFFDWQQHFERCIYLFSAQILRNVLGQAEFIQSSNSSCSISSRCGMSFPQRATRSSYKYFDTGLEFSIQAAKKKKKKSMMYHFKRSHFWFLKVMKDSAKFKGKRSQGRLAENRQR